MFDFRSDDFCQARMSVVKESSEAVEIGQRSGGPLQFH
jgi:hypothetical protein